MQDQARLQVHHQRDQLAFFAQLDFIKGQVTNLFPLDLAVLTLELGLVDHFDRIPAQPRQLGGVLNRHHPAA